MAMMPALIIGFVIFGIAGWIWRINLALNHREKEIALRELAEHIKKEQGEVIEKVGEWGKKGTALGLKLWKRWK
jgi:hypothetical protein